MIQILELFGGIGAPRIALRNLGVPVKSIDYVEIDEKCVASYNSMFRNELEYKTQTVVGWNLKPDILVHGSPCQDMSIAGHQGRQRKENGRTNHGKGAEKNSGTRSALVWETVRIIRELGEYRPYYVIWENVANTISNRYRHTYNQYLEEMKELGYTNSFEVLDARDFGLPQYRERVFTVSTLGKEPFTFDDLERKPMRPLSDFLLPDSEVSDAYDVTQPSILGVIGAKGIHRTTVLDPASYCYTITTRQDRCPAQIIDRGDGRYRFLTEQECWRLQGYTDADFENARKAHVQIGKWYPCLYKQSGNSIPVPIFEAMFRKMLMDPKLSGEYQLSLAI